MWGNGTLAKKSCRDQLPPTEKQCKVHTSMTSIVHSHASNAIIGLSKCIYQRCDSPPSATHPPQSQPHPPAQGPPASSWASQSQIAATVGYRAGLRSAPRISGNCPPCRCCMSGCPKGAAWMPRKSPVRHLATAAPAWPTRLREACYL